MEQPPAPEGRELTRYAVTGDDPPLNALVLAWASEWHCLPSEAQAEYEDHVEYLANPVIRHCAKAWGVRPSRVVREDAVWTARQMHIDEVRANHALAVARRLQRTMVH